MIGLKKSLISGNIFRVIYLKQVRNVSYVQGQSPKPGIREYFYYIDHQGQVRLQVYLTLV